MQKIRTKKKGSDGARRASRGQKVKHKQKDATPAPTKPPRREDTKSADPATGVHAVPAESLGTSSSPFDRVALGLVFRLDPTQIHTAGEVDAADLAAIKQRVLLAEGPLAKARTDVAKVLQVSPTALPVVWSQCTAEEIFVGLLPPDDVELQALPEAQRAAVEAIAGDWRDVVSKLSGSVDRKDEGEGRGSSRRAEAKKKDQRIEPSAKRLEQALGRGTQTHGVEVTIVSNGLRGELPALVRARPAPPPTLPSLGKPEVVVAHIERATGNGTCELRTNGSRRKQFGEFSASGVLPMQIALAAGCPPVHLRVRRYLVDGTPRRAGTDFRVDELVALSSVWFEGSPSVLDHLAQCVAALRELPCGDSAAQQELR